MDNGVYPLFGRKIVYSVESQIYGAELFPVLTKHDVEEKETQMIPHTVSNVCVCEGGKKYIKNSLTRLLYKCRVFKYMYFWDVCVLLTVIFIPFVSWQSFLN